MSLNKKSSSATVQSGDLSNYVADVDLDLKNVFQRLRRTPDITTGTAAPTTTPSRVGNIYVDTTNKKLYFAVGHSTSADWIIAN